MRTITILSALMVAGSMSLVGCGDDDADGTGGSGNAPTGGTGGTPTGGTGGQPMGGNGGDGGMGGTGGMGPYELGPQVDRIGRPAINTAANNTFTDDVARGVAEDDWNANDDPTTWAADYTADVADTIAIIDAVDGTCNNQLLNGCDACGVDVALPDCDTIADSGTCYDALAGVLTGDFLWVKTNAQDTCETYLAVEADAVAVLPNDDCGGRRPTDDVIERSYSVLAAGVLAGIDDFVPVDPATAAAQAAGFPYLADPAM